MRVLQLLRPPLQRRMDDLQRRHLDRVGNDVSQLLSRAAIAADHQLHHADRRDQRHRHQLEQTAGSGDLRCFDIHAVGFHRAEHLFDGPAHLVPGSPRA